MAAPTQAKGVALNAGPALEAEADHWASARRAASGVVGPVTVRAAVGAVQAKTVSVLNFDRLADQIHKTVDGQGTDEEAGYSALAALQHDAGNIAALETAYKKHGDLRADLEDAYKAAYSATLRDDLIDDFSGAELKHTLELLGDRGTSMSKIESQSPSVRRRWDETRARSSCPYRSRRGSAALARSTEHQRSDGARSWCAVDRGWRDSARAADCRRW